MILIRKWIWQQDDLGDLNRREGVWNFALKVSLRCVILAIGLGVVVLPILYTINLLSLSLEQAMMLTVFFAWVFGGVTSLTLSLVAGYHIVALLLSRAEFERLSRTDSLSGLPNRRAFNDALAEMTDGCSLAIVDIDRFKLINDRFGHRAGDMVIREISSLLLTEKLPGLHLAARLGGEEFGLVLQGQDISDHLSTIDHLRQLIEARIMQLDGHSLSVTISAGVAEFGQGRRPEWVYARADQALYFAKAQGRNRVVHESMLDCPDYMPPAPPVSRIFRSSSSKQRSSILPIA